MKDTMDPAPVGEPAEKEGFSNRKLIRPTLPKMDHGNHSSPQLQMPDRRERPERLERHDRPVHDLPGHDRPGHERGGHERVGGDRAAIGGKKPAPPEQTNAENFYYQKQMQGQTPMVIVLRDGEQVHGIIEWYDRNCIKVLRNAGQSNLMIYKPAIKYMFKEGEGS